MSEFHQPDGDSIAVSKEGNADTFIVALWPGYQRAGTIREIVGTMILNQQDGEDIKPTSVYYAADSALREAVAHIEPDPYFDSARHEGFVLTVNDRQSGRTVARAWWGA